MFGPKVEPPMQQRSPNKRGERSDKSTKRRKIPISSPLVAQHGIGSTPPMRPSGGSNRASGGRIRPIIEERKGPNHVEMMSIGS